MDSRPTPIVRDLILVGGGHSHIAVLKRFGMRPVPGVQITLVCRDVHTPYSGMLPGLVAGHYTYDEAHIDLRRLAVFSSARFIHDEVVTLDPDRNELLFRDRPAIRYDLLSLNTGSTPGLRDVPGAAEHAVAVKPISEFLPRWQALLQRVRGVQGAPRIAVVGAGAGGVELTLAIQHRLRSSAAPSGASADPEMHLFSATAAILPTHNARVRGKFERILASRGVKLHRNATVTGVTADGLATASGWRGAFDEVVWVTNASAADWLGASGLATDSRGFVRVDERLRSVSHPSVYAAGDVAAVDAHAREKAGVFAVRQGPPLAENLRLALRDRPPRPFRPQRKFLSLISTGDQYAVASRGGWSVEGRWAWKWKDRIDRRFMAKFHDLPPMADSRPAGEPPPATADFPHPHEHEIRCRGCASKVGAATLAGALGSIEPFWREDVPAGLATRDDAAILHVPEGKSLVQSVDFFPAIVDDPYLFGRIAANHALSDIFAMGAAPQSALAVAGIPFAAARKSEDLLRQMLLGANETFREARTNLAGGHTSECPELALGFVINGLAPEGEILRKEGLRPGDTLVLTKALGTGVLFAAEMRLAVKGRWIDAAIDSMLQSSQRAAEILRAHGATACTDVTGFGLAGHLVEMLEASQAGASIDLGSLPGLEGAAECHRAGIRSSLFAENVKIWQRVSNGAGVPADPDAAILFDPQTSGGLLAGIPEANAEPCLEALREAGYSRACRIGSVRLASEATMVTLNGLSGADQRKKSS